MDQRDESYRRRQEELIEAFERERSQMRDLNRQLEEHLRDSRDRDRQVLIERRRQPR